MSKYNEHSDLELITLLKEGDRAAYTEIYNRYTLILLNHAYNKLRNREEAKDIIHEAFTILWSKREMLDLKTNLSGYLYTIVRNTILNLIVYKQVQGKYLNSMEKFSLEGHIIADHLVRSRQLEAIIEKEIADLPPKMRRVFELSRKSYLNHKEISFRLNISEQTVSKHITNALKVLRVRLGIFSVLLGMFFF